MTVKDISTRDHQRVQNLQDKGYNVEIIWEKDWQALLTQRPEIKVFLAQCRTFTHFKKYLTQDCLDHVGEVMQEYAKEHSIKDVPRRLLIGSYFGKKIGLSTPLLKWYLEHGLVITHIYTVIEYVPNAAFNSFMMQVAQARLDGDRDKDKALIAETMKLIGNSSYGKLITKKEKHHDIVYVDESEIGAEIMDKHFYGLTELPNGYYEVE